MTVFDHLIAGRLPASFVHQDAHCVAFMDIKPITRGHVLVVPRQSVATLAELDPDVAAHLWRVAGRIGPAQQRALGSVAQHLMLNDGRGASQTVPHVHVHVIPRYPGDHARTLIKLMLHIATLGRSPREYASLRRRLDQQAQAIATALAPPTG